MVTPINLNKARKAKQSAHKQKSAAANRIKFGRTKAEKQVEKSRRDKLGSHVDGHELDK